MLSGDSAELEVALSRDDHEATIGCAATNTIGTVEGSISIDVKCKFRVGLSRSGLLMIVW